MKDKINYISMVLAMVIIIVILFSVLMMMYRNYDISYPIYTSSKYLIFLPTSV